MRLNDLEKAMLAGETGEPRRLAIEQQMEVGRYFDAEDFVEVSQVHLMADTESLGPAGVAFLERMAAHAEAERRVRVPTVTDPRGIDFAAYKRLKVTGTGKLKRRKANKSHILTKKHQKRKRGLRQATLVSKADEGRLRRLLGK